jgi:hypothetical protein
VSENELVSSRTGTVRFVDLEGGFYGIADDSGESWDPLNLDDELRVDGLRVRFSGIVRNDVSTLRMWGRPLQITSIERLP